MSPDPDTSSSYTSANAGSKWMECVLSLCSRSAYPSGPMNLLQDEITPYLYHRMGQLSGSWGKKEDGQALWEEIKA